MPSTLRKHAGLFVGSTLFGLFHLLTIVSTLISTRGSGEGQAFAVLLLDFPLVLLLQAIPGGGIILYNSTTAYILFFSIAGTLMYVAIGGLLGVLVDKLRQRLNRRQLGK
jgi:hypothetical protein